MLDDKFLEDRFNVIVPQTQNPPHGRVVADEISKLSVFLHLATQKPKKK